MTATPTYNLSQALIIIPAFNAGKHLEELISRLRRTVPKNDILVVDDGSTDRTQELLSELNADSLLISPNKGKGEALMTGFRRAVARGYRSVLTMDADLQHLPEEVPALLDHDDGCNLVLGTRQIDRSVMPAARCLSNNLTSLIVSVFSSRRIRDSQTGFRVVPAWLIRRLRLRSGGFSLESELLFRAAVLGCKVVEAPVSTVYNESISHIRHSRDTLRFIRETWRRLWM